MQGLRSGSCRIIARLIPVQLKKSSFAPWDMHIAHHGVDMILDNMQLPCAEECARELCAGMNASSGKAAPNPDALARLVLVTCERLVTLMVEKVR